MYDDMNGCFPIAKILACKQLRRHQADSTFCHVIQLTSHQDSDCADTHFSWVIFSNGIDFNLHIMGRLKLLFLLFYEHILVFSSV